MTVQNVHLSPLLVLPRIESYMVSVFYHNCMTTISDNKKSTFSYICISLHFMPLQGADYKLPYVNSCVIKQWCEGSEGRHLIFVMHFLLSQLLAQAACQDQVVIIGRAQEGGKEVLAPQRSGGFPPVLTQYLENKRWKFLFGCWNMV